MLIRWPADRSVALLHVSKLVAAVPVQVVAPLFGVPVVPVQAHRRLGLDALKAAIQELSLIHI